jgi:hypothetical protein
MDSAIPITALIAIVIFIIKELIESYRARKNRNRTKNTVSMLLSYELECNFWSVKSLFGLFNKLKEYRHLDEITLSLKKGIESNYSVKIENKHGEWTGQAVPPFCHQRFDSLLVQISELGNETYEKLQDAYSCLNELEDYRAQVINLFAGEDWITFPDMTFDYLSMKAEEYDEYYRKLNDAYVCLTGNNLLNHRLD